MALVNFNGQSGRSHAFERVGHDAPWAKEEGIALFAAPGAYGWRVIQIVELDGRDDNVQPIWAYRNAQRYGARAVFICPISRVLERKTAIADLRLGLTPVCDQDRTVAVA